MKIIKRIATIVLLLGLFWVPAVHAADDVLKNTCDEVPNASACQDRNQTNADNALYGTNGILTKVTRLISVLIGVASVIMIIIGGFKYVLSNGDSAGINSAKDTIMYALIGLAISLVAQAIVLLVVNSL